MTLTWCSVHALKNKVLLKTPSGSLVLKLINSLKPFYSISVIIAHI